MRLMLKADFHLHTHYSKCSNTKPSDLVRIAVSKSYDAIGVVDHNNIKGGLETKRIAGKKILVIPGEEIKTEYGEVIIFLSDGKYSRRLAEVCDRAKDENNFLIVPHPFDLMRRESIKKNIVKVKKMDAIEVFNSRVFINVFNDKANAYAEKNKIAKIAGSDAHSLSEIGNVTCFLDCNNNVESIFKYIRKNKIKFIYKKSPLVENLKSEFLKLSRLL